MQRAPLRAAACLSACALFVTLGCTASGGPSSRTPTPPGATADGGAPPPGSARDAGGPPPPPPPTSCSTGPGLDADGDGAVSEVDCNDCSPQINPGALDFPGNGIDEDCDGADATETAACDLGLPIAPGSANDAAKAIGLCKFLSAGEVGHGVISARFTTADGAGMPDSLEQAGVLPSFGAATPHQGASMLALSSGVARAPGQPGYTSDCDFFDPYGEPSPSGNPPGHPIGSPACPGVVGGRPYNAVALEVQVRAPTNARGFSFRSSFYTTEFPVFVCDVFNDFFVVLRGDGSAAPTENIVFDDAGNPVSVNNAFLRACTPQTYEGRTHACPAGPGFLAGSGFDGSARCGQDESEPGVAIGASTGWLRTTAPVVGGEVLTLRFAIWDSEDPTLDSLVLIDGFEWELEEPDITETVPELI